MEFLHMHGTMVFAKALLCLGRCLMATQHALWVPYDKRSDVEKVTKTDRQTHYTNVIVSLAERGGNEC